MSKTQNIEDIVSCATRLFARQGYDATSLRQIAHDAKVGLGSINFCFQTKENLFLEVIGRVINEINGERRALLRAARESGFSIEQVLDAALWPVVSRVTSSDLTERGKPHLVRWAMQGPRAVESHARKLNDSISREFVDAILEAMPSLERRDAVWGFAVLISTAYSRHVLDHRYDHLMDPKPAGSGSERALESSRRLIGLVVGGLQTLCERELPILKEHSQPPGWYSTKAHSRH